MAVKEGRGGLNPMPLKKFENLQIKNYMKYWENEYRTLSFSFFIYQSQHNIQHTIIKSNKESSKCSDQGIKEKIWYLYDIFNLFLSLIFFSSVLISFQNLCTATSSFSRKQNCYTSATSLYQDSITKKINWCLTDISQF